MREGPFLCPSALGPCGRGSPRSPFAKSEVRVSTSSICTVPFASSVRRTVMVNGWSAVATPSGRSAHWTFSLRQGQFQTGVEDVGAILHTATSRSFHGSPSRSVKQLQKAVDVLDVKDPFVASLRAELQKARSKARVVPCRRPCQVPHSSLREGTEVTRSWRPAQEDIRDGERGWSGSGWRRPRRARHVAGTMTKGSKLAHWPLIQSIWSPRVRPLHSNGLAPA